MKYRFRYKTKNTKNILLNVQTEANIKGMYEK